jgi:uncharacterized protein (TIGR02453 family)
MPESAPQDPETTVMLQAATLRFLKDLKKNNNKTWFEKNKDNFLAAKEDMERFAGLLIEALGRKDPAIATLQPKDCVFRIYRDVRFSKDKTPYKPNMGVFFNRGGKKAPTAGYYFHCVPGQNRLGGGLWMPMAPELNKVRQEIDYNFAEWTAIVNHRTFKALFPKGLIDGESLSRPPKGYDESNPAIEYLKKRSFVVITTLKDAELQSKTLVKTVLKIFGGMKPFIDFLNNAME